MDAYSISNTARNVEEMLARKVAAGVSNRFIYIALTIQEYNDDFEPFSDNYDVLCQFFKDKNIEHFDRDPNEHAYAYWDVMAFHPAAADIVTEEDADKFDARVVPDEWVYEQQKRMLKTFRAEFKEYLANYWCEQNWLSN